MSDDGMTATEIATLRERAHAAADGRRVWYFGFRKGDKREPPRGGQQIAVQHARILRDAGIDCHLVTVGGGAMSRRNPFSRPDEETTTAPESWFRREFDPDRDFVVVPGSRMNRLHMVPGKNVVIFSQNVFVTARVLGLNGQGWKSRAVAIMALSQGNTDLIELAQPDCPVLTVRSSVSPKLFMPREKERLVLSNGLGIGFEKNPFDLAALQQIIVSRSGRQTEPFEHRALENLTHQQVGELMGRARTLFFPSTHEGLGLLPLEAMLAGAVVFAFRRPPMTEYLPERCQFDFGDLGGMADAVIDVLDHPENWQDVVEQGRATALEYSPAAQERSVLETWLQIASDIAG